MSCPQLNSWGPGGEEAPVENVHQGTGRRPGDWTRVSEVSRKGILPETHTRTHTHTGSRQLWEMQRAPLQWKEKPPVTAGQREREKKKVRERECVHERERYQCNSSELQMWWLKAALPTPFFKPTKPVTLLHTHPCIQYFLFFVLMSFWLFSTRLSENGHYTSIWA